MAVSLTAPSISVNGDDCGADPRDFLPEGETVNTAVAFDVPKGVSGLRLRSEALDIEVTLQ